jgi:hypothetical protein
MNTDSWQDELRRGFFLLIVAVFLVLSRRIRFVRPRYHPARGRILYLRPRTTTTNQPTEGTGAIHGSAD